MIPHQEITAIYFIFPKHLLYKIVTNTPGLQSSIH